MIVGSLCTIPLRRDSFRFVLQRLLKEQTCQVDKLHIWLNGYKEIPVDLPHDVRLIYHLEPSNPGPWVRYQSAQGLPNDDVFMTIDDDQIYPVDYIEKGVAALRSRPDAAISFCGFRWDELMPPLRWNYTRGRITIFIQDDVAKWQPLAFLMGFSSFFYPWYLQGIIQLSVPGFTTNDDMMISSGLHQRNIPIFCPPRPANWIRDQGQANAPHALYRRDAATRHIVFRQLVDQLGFDPTAGQLVERLKESERWLILSPTSPDAKFENWIKDYAILGHAVHVLFPVPNKFAVQAQSYCEHSYFSHPVSYIDLGGRFEWLLPVHWLRERRVRNEKETLFIEQAQYAVQQLQPQRVFAVDGFDFYLPGIDIERLIL